MCCRECLKAYVMGHVRENRTSTIVCPECQTMLAPRDLRELLSEDEMAQYERASVAEAAGGDLVTCPNASCGCVMELVRAEPSPSEIEQAQKELAGERPVSADAARHHCQYRLRCRACGTEFCAQCSATPYHAGYTCAEWADYAKARHCRYCGAKVVGSELVCGSDECKEKHKQACHHRLPCGHQCCGIARETKHLPCLAEDCPDALKFARESNQSGDDFCGICFVEDLRSAPCIRLECGHIFHYACVLQKLRARWPASRITFGFLECPLCKKPMRHPALQAELAPLMEIRRETEKRAVKRLHELGMDKSDEVTKPGKPYYKNPVGYAMHRFSYFLCYKCHQPYYGGERVCEGDQVREYDPKELLCSGCCEFSAQATCPIHGNDYIEWKCRFCCNVAVYFCWGTTHFCEMCHRKAGQMARTPVDQLPPCTCGLKHPPNGTEFLLGCSLCRLNQSCFK